jgi:hypothetical protein
MYGAQSEGSNKTWWRAELIDYTLEAELFSLEWEKPFDEVIARNTRQISLIDTAVINNNSPAELRHDVRTEKQLTEAFSTSMGISEKFLASFTARDEVSSGSSGTESRSRRTEVGISDTDTSGLSQTHSNSISSSSSRSHSNGQSLGETQSVANSKSQSSSSGNTLLQSESNSKGSSVSESESEAIGVSDSFSRGSSNSRTQSRSQSFTNAISESVANAASQALSRGSSSETGGSVGHSIGVQAGFNIGFASGGVSSTTNFELRHSSTSSQEERNENSRTETHQKVSYWIGFLDKSG